MSLIRTWELGPMVSVFTGFGPGRIAERITTQNYHQKGVLRLHHGRVAYVHVSRESRTGQPRARGRRRHQVSMVYLLPARKIEGVVGGHPEVWSLREALRLANDIAAGPLAGATPLGPEGLSGTGWENGGGAIVFFPAWAPRRLEETEHSS